MTTRGFTESIISGACSATSRKTPESSTLPQPSPQPASLAAPPATAAPSTTRTPTGESPTFSPARRELQHSSPYTIRYGPYAPSYAFSSTPTATFVRGTADAQTSIQFTGVGFDNYTVSQISCRWGADASPTLLVTGSLTFSTFLGPSTNSIGVSLTAAGLFVKVRFAIFNGDEKFFASPFLDANDDHSYFNGPEVDSYFVTAKGSTDQRIPARKTLPVTRMKIFGQCFSDYAFRNIACKLGTGLLQTATGRTEDATVLCLLPTDIVVVLGVRRRQRPCANLLDHYFV